MYVVPQMSLSCLHEQYAANLTGDTLLEYLLDATPYLSTDDLAGWILQFRKTNSSTSSNSNSIPTPSTTLTHTISPTQPGASPNGEPRKKRRKMSPNTVVWTPLAACKECHSDEVIEDSTAGCVVCTMCGLVQSPLLQNGIGNMDLNNPRCTPHKVHHYSRIVYFRSFLMSIQAETAPQIPPLVLEALRLEAGGSAENITKASLLKAMRRRNLCNNYRRHTLSLLHTLTKKAAPETIKLEHAHFTQLLRHFRAIESAWDQNVTNKRGRKVFLSYSYVFYQLCYHLDIMQYTGKHHLLKSRVLLARIHDLYHPLASFAGYKADIKVFR